MDCFAHTINKIFNLAVLKNCFSFLKNVSLAKSLWNKIRNLHKEFREHINLMYHHFQLLFAENLVILNDRAPPLYLFCIMIPTGV